MSLSKALQNVHRGPLKLNHDLTPKDVAEYSPSNTELKPEPDQFGFKGYAAHNFERANQPAAGQELETDLWKSPRHESHGVPHYLGKPRHAGEGVGLKYGSSGINNAVEPSPRKNLLLNPKTSAELRKFHHHQEEAEKDIQKYKMEKMQKLQQREAEKKQDLEMLQNFNPWGKPGGGAPRKAGETEANKMARMDDHELFNKEVPAPRQNELKQEYGDFHSYFNKPGHGAPLRTDSGTVKTQLKGDAQIRFQDSDVGRVVNSTEVRYRAPGEVKQGYHQDLEKQVETSKVKSHEQRLQELKQDLEMIQKYDPFGKPGAGAPNKTQSERERRPVNRTQSETDEFDPWGKGYGQPVRNKHGDVQRFKYSNSGTKEPYTHDSLREPIGEDGTMLDVNTTRGGGGAPLKTESGNVNTKLPITMKRNERGDTSFREQHASNPASDPDHAIYDPWGKSGAGAPIKDDKGQLKTNVYGKLKDVSGQSVMSGDPRERQRAKQQILDDLQKEMEIQKRSKNNRDKSAENDLAALMRQGQVGRPRRDPNTGMLTNQHLGASDVTKQQTQERTWKNADSSAYHTELEQAAVERKQNQQLDKLKDKHDWTHHQSTMNDFWGRPGAGAPVGNAKKANLENILHSPRKEANDFYKKNTNGGPKPYNYVRNTVNSMHQNHYEFNTTQRRQPKKDYNLLTPYATNGEAAY